MNFLKNYTLVGSYVLLILLSFVGAYIVLFQREEVIYDVEVPCADIESTESCIVQTTPKLFNECQYRNDMTEACLVP